MLVPGKEPPASRPRSPEELAAGVYWLTAGRRPLAANVYFIRTDDGWVLVDTAWASDGAAIRAAANSLFGLDIAPTAIVLTHIHLDHSGSVPELVRRWRVPVYIHPAEMPLGPGGYMAEYANPLDRRVIAPILRLIPPRRLEAMRIDRSLEGIVTPQGSRRGHPCPERLAMHTHSRTYTRSCRALPGLRRLADHRRRGRDRRLELCGRITDGPPGGDRPIFKAASAALQALAVRISVHT